MESVRTNQEALDEAVRRFPWLLQKLRMDFDLSLIERYVPTIIREYQLILLKEVGRQLR